MENTILDIGEVVKRSGLPVSTLRYYEQKKLIASVGRNGLRRNFDASVLERLALITLGRNAGFSLDEIAAMLTLESPEISREQLSMKATELDKIIQQLSALRDGLRHAAECPAPNHLECPKFQRLMRIAVKDQRRKLRSKDRKTTSCARP